MKSKSSFNWRRGAEAREKAKMVWRTAALQIPMPIEEWNTYIKCEFLMAQTIVTKEMGAAKRLLQSAVRALRPQKDR